MRNYIILFIYLICFSATAKIDYQLSYLSSSTSYNYFSLPNNNEQNRFDIKDTTSVTNYRLFIEKYFSDWSLTLLYAPLTINYSQLSDKNFSFNETNFSAGLDTTIKYKFNSYRLGYRKNFFAGKNRFYWGGLLKIRDAEICVSQQSVNNCYDNIGPVPLLNLGAEIYGDLFYSKFSIDGLFSSRGSAYDANVETGIDFNNFSLGIGFRILGGGADNDKLINFAQFQSWYLGITI